MDGLSSLQPLVCLSKLKVLALQDCKNVTDLEQLNQLTSLTCLCTYGCGIDDLSSLSLQSLDSLACKAPSCHGLSNLTSLTALTFFVDEYADADLPQEDWEEFQHLPKLVNLELRNMSMDHFRYLRVGSLTELETWGGTGALTAADLQGIQGLRKLCLSLCFDMEDLSPLSTLRNLEELSVVEHGGLKEGPSLHVSSLTSLRCLTG
jgi:hypothetical protein